MNFVVYLDSYPPPLIFIGESHELHGAELQLCLQEPPLGANQELPCQWSKAVGTRWARPTGLVGRRRNCPDRPQLWLVGCPDVPYVQTKF